MGFNITVRHSLDNHDHPCRATSTIPRSYFVFMASVELFGDESAVIAAGRAAGVDLRPFTVYSWTDSMPEFDDDGNEVDRTSEPQPPPESHWIAIDEAIRRARAFRDYTAAHPSMLRTADFDAKENIGQKHEFIEYVESGEIVRDFDRLIESLECHRAAGHDRVFFEAG